MSTQSPFLRWFRRANAALGGANRRGAGVAIAVVVTLGCAWGINGCAAGEGHGQGASGDGGGATTAVGSGGPGGKGGAAVGGNGGMAGDGGAGGNGTLCAVDCSSINTPQCLKSVCNEGAYPGVIGSCVVVPAEAGAKCDDDKYCTVNDVCNDEGVCVGGGDNDCGTPASSSCEVVTCDEATKSCSTAPANDGVTCTPTNKCEVGGSCLNGLCVGTPQDCFFAPAGDCETAVCDPKTGMCVPVPNFNMDGNACNTGDFCQQNKTCSGGVCGNGIPKDCSSFDGECVVGACDPNTGVCGVEPMAVGSSCSEAADGCNTGSCDANQVCQPTPLADGTVCDDFSLCTNMDQCTAGVCSGVLNTTCDTYYSESFEACPPPGWGLNAEWECGAPINGPAAAYQGSQLLGLDLDGSYDALQSYGQAYAQTPKISLANATAPVMRYHHWVDTEGGPFDGYHVGVSTDNGVTFTVVTTVTPSYPLTVAGEPAFGGYNQVWETVDVDLSAYAGQQVVLRFGFQSDGSFNGSGVYIDAITIAEPSALP